MKKYFSLYWRKNVRKPNTLLSDLIPYRPRKKSWQEDDLTEEKLPFKYGKSQDTKTLVKMLLLLVPLLFFALTVGASEKNEKIIRNADDGVFFTCPVCRTSQWQHRSKADLAGRYYCNRCGTKAH